MVMRNKKVYKALFAYIKSSNKDVCVFNNCYKVFSPAVKKHFFLYNFQKIYTYYLSSGMDRICKFIESSILHFLQLIAT